MEAFLSKFFILLAVTSVFLNFLHLKKLINLHSYLVDIKTSLKELKTKNDSLNKSLVELLFIAAKISSQLHAAETEKNRSTLAQKDSETTKPMKSNNWDSVREAFKGPARTDVNDRN